VDAYIVRLLKISAKS